MNFREGDRVEVNPGYGWRDGVVIGRWAYFNAWLVRYKGDDGSTYESYFSGQNISRRQGDFA